jgi:glucan 1,3-beta-glucosidase
VRDYGAAGDGTTDDTAAFQAAIDAGNDYANRTTNSLGTTGQPAVVYVPRGEYLLRGPLQLYVGTVVMGDATDRPTLRAAKDTDAAVMVYAKDPHHVPTINFFIGVKNLVFDSTAVAADKEFTLLEWSVSQNTQLANVEFTMPTDSAHTGVSMVEGGSGTEINDLAFVGGGVGECLVILQASCHGRTPSREFAAD